jgi:hypothetical protein
MTTVHTVYLIWNKGSRRMWPVNRGCSLLHGTWSHLWHIERSVYAHSLICISYRTYEIDYCSLFLSFHEKNTSAESTTSIYFHSWWNSIDLEIRLTSDVTGQPGMLTPPWQLIPMPLHVYIVYKYIQYSIIYTCAIFRNASASRGNKLCINYKDRNINVGIF